MIGIALLFETDVGAMPVHHLRIAYWAGIAPTTTSRHSVDPIIVPSEHSSHLRCCVPRWYDAGPPPPDADPAPNQQFCRRQH